MARGAVNALIAGPNPKEAAAGVKSSVPTTSRLRGVVHSPLIGAVLPPTVRVTGTSDVFEAALVVKVLNG